MKQVKSSLNGTNVRNKPYATPVNSANFFFADKFIVLVSNQLKKI